MDLLICRWLLLLIRTGFSFTESASRIYLSAFAPDRFRYGTMAKEAAKYALGIFIIFVVTIILLGHMPLYIPQ